MRRDKLLAFLIRYRRVRVHVALVPRGLGFGAGAASESYLLSAHAEIINRMFLVRGEGKDVRFEALRVQWVDWFRSRHGCGRR